MNKISIKGVIIGSVIDIVATNIVSIPLIVYVMITRNLATLPKDQIANALMLTLQNDPKFFSIQVLLGSLCSVLGGYIAAKIAKRHEVLNGALASFLCIGFGIYGLFFSTLAIPIWHQLAGFIASPALSAFGGYLQKLSNRHQLRA